MHYAGLIYDDSRHYIDHLAPLCALLGWPLITCEPSVAILARKYYPDLEVIEQGLWDLKLPPCIVACDSKPLLRAAFPNQSCKLLWLPHGNSDKNSVFEQLGEIALTSWKQMTDRIHSTRTVSVGNFRWEYFLKHQKFYQNMIHFPQKGKKILYAPTWDDSENNCSFWKAFPRLVNHLPKDCHLLVKLHPNTLQKYAAELEVLIGRYTKNVYFLPEIPPIYPILGNCDAYIGDMSSVGYDFLTFDRPMYFLNAKPHLPLHACGWGIEPEGFCLRPDPFSKVRKATYQHTFDPVPSWEVFKRYLAYTLTTATRP